MVNTILFTICVLFLFAFIFSLLINRVFLKFSKNLGIRNIDDKVIRWNTTSKPSFGGISFFIVFLLIVTLAPLFLDGFALKENFKLIGILLATSIGFLVGLTDDAFNTNPLLKSIAQTLCALVLIFTGTVIDVSAYSWVNYVLTFLWVVGLMNSINMLDNMDGVTSIASINALIAMVFVILLSNNVNNIYFVVVVGIIGALLGFLFFNWHPSKMYMGDTGSQFLGVILAALSIIFLWNNNNVEEAVISRQFILPLLAFIVPLVDTTTVTINRIQRGSSPFVGGKDHTTHHLSYLGFSDQSVALIIGGIGLVSNVMLLLALSVSNWSHLFTTIFCVFALIVFLSLFLITKNKFSNRKHESKERSIKKSA